MAAARGGDAEAPLVFRPVDIALFERSRAHSKKRGDAGEIVLRHIDEALLRAAGRTTRLAGEPHHHRWCTSGLISRSYISAAARICAAVSGGRSLAAVFSPACAGRLAPGIAHVTASCIRIQRNANCAIVIPAGTTPRSSSTARNAV